MTGPTNPATDQADRILALLDNAGQTTTEDSYGTGQAGLCWRCNRNPEGDTASGLCDGCRTFMLGDTTDDPTQGHRTAEPLCVVPLDNLLAEASATAELFAEHSARVAEIISSRAEPWAEAWGSILQLATAEDMWEQTFRHYRPRFIRSMYDPMTNEDVFTFSGFEADDPPDGEDMPAWHLPSTLPRQRRAQVRPAAGQRGRSVAGMGRRPRADPTHVPGRRPDDQTADSP